MNIFTVSFFGHRQINEPFKIEAKLKKVIEDLIFKKEYVQFIVGRDGEFDQLVSSAVRRYKSSVRDDNSSLVLILPYMTAEYRNNSKSFSEYYDEVIVCPKSMDKHYKSAHRIRNQYMVDSSDMIVFYIEHKHGGAYQTMKYAMKNNKYYINLLG